MKKDVPQKTLKKATGSFKLQSYATCTAISCLMNASVVNVDPKLKKDFLSKSKAVSKTQSFDSVASTIF